MKAARRDFPWGAEEAMARMMRRRAALIMTLFREQAAVVIGRGIDRERVDSDLLPWDADPWAAEEWLTGPAHARVILPVLDPMLDDAYRGDVDQTLVADLIAIIRDLQVGLVRLFPFSMERLAPFSSQVDRHATRVVARQIGQPIVGSDLDRATLRAWARDNASKVEAFDKRILDDMARAIVRAAERGLPAKDLGAVIAERSGMARRKADLVARDAIGTLNGQITRAKHEAAGFHKFKWRDSDDKRVRPLHAEIDGKVYDYPVGHPTEGLPGEPILCRCVAQPER